MRAPLGLEPFDEYVLWGLLGASLRSSDAELLSTPQWMLRMLGLDVGGTQYAQLRRALDRLAASSYHNTAFYNPTTKEHEVAAFQFLSVLLPTVGGHGNTVDDDRCWRIVWNPVLLAYCQATGGNLLFDLDLFRSLTPAARRLFLKLKDRFWRSKSVFFNVDDLTINGMGYSPRRPFKKRKHDLTACLRELRALDVIKLNPGLSDPAGLFLQRGTGRYTLVLEEGSYVRPAYSVNSIRSLRAVADDPLSAPLQQIGVDAAAIRRLLGTFDRGLIKRWVRTTDTAMHEKPRGFPGFRTSPAAFLIDGVHNRRQAPDWMFAHEKLQRQQQQEAKRARAMQDDYVLRRAYNEERAAAFEKYAPSPEAQRLFAESFPILLEFHRRTDPHGCYEAARVAAWKRIEQIDFTFPDFETWLTTHQIVAE